MFLRCAVSRALCCVPGAVLCPWCCAVSLALGCVPGAFRSVLCPWRCAVSLALCCVPGAFRYARSFKEITCRLNARIVSDSIRNIRIRVTLSQAIAPFLSWSEEHEIAFEDTKPT